MNPLPTTSERAPRAGGKGQLSAGRLRVVLYEGEGARPLEPTRRATVLAALLSAGHQVTRASGGHSVSPLDRTYHVLLGEFSAQPTASGQEADLLSVIDIAGFDPEEIAARVTALAESTGELKTPGDWKPWFPVIDYERCTNCMQCLTFCLFDVYGADDNKVIQVQNEDNCKTDCPACSRVCPEAAILFPKYKAGPINGAEVTDNDLKREAMKVDISALLGGDIYSALKGRSKQARERFSTERDESKALIERKRCLKEIGEALDIPDEVLMTLPSAGDIEDRARRAKEKAEKRRARSRTVADQRRPATEKEWDI